MKYCYPVVLTKTEEGYEAYKGEYDQKMSIKSGSKVAFVVKGKTVRLVNPAIYAMEYMQEQMKEYANSMTDEEVMAMIKELRDE